MVIQTATFVKSSPKWTQCPPPNYPEFAFIGRSNVGKSSLINMLTGRKSLAKTSATPGKTQLLNHFLINDRWYLVDLPGYGWARVSKQSRQTWKKMTFDYLENRENLLCVFVLIDARHEPQKADLEFIRTLGQKKIPFTLTFTKTDKLTKNKLSQNLASYKKVLLKEWEYLPDIFLSSAVDKQGRNELLDFIDSLLNNT